MGRGKLLVGAKGLDNTDFLNNMDPYVILTCRSQEKKSSVASDVQGLFLKIMDSDSVGEDDFVGEAKNIPRESVKKALADGKSLLIDVKHQSIDQFLVPQSDLIPAVVFQHVVE
ncbi:hypothetical protein K7X08_029373 [Anisodus acutangulus]|uniref:C2 domain-containing protein n=1 Tax=Anisodus acutangulus TaxID=402998 RepID=A0A9Q1QUP5_9SOLA|nr:hypothetical protein K7X08_029373 [Anisodus acutangulus]